MDFADKIKQFSKKIEMIKDKLETEESTKTALVMPFFSLLYYDVFNPLEFVPEYTCDVGIKKGEKVDYAIIKDNKPVILIEVKNVNDNLSKHDNQLFRYFTASCARFSILTNGIVYKFFTDLEEKNKMDEKPFLEVNLLDLSDMKINELKKFTKENFDIDTIFNTASELKYTNLIKLQLTEQLNEPSDDFVRFIISDFFTGVKTLNVVEKFRGIVKKSMHQFVNEFMNDKIKSILNEEQKDLNEEVDEKEELLEEDVENKTIVTTEEELEGFKIVRSILSELVDPEFITHKDVERYFGILYKGNARKWICRLYFNSNRKKIVISDIDKKEITYYINSVNEIYKYKDLIINSLLKYLESAKV